MELGSMEKVPWNSMELWIWTKIHAIPWSFSLSSLSAMAFHWTTKIQNGYIFTRYCNIFQTIWSGSFDIIYIRGVNTSNGDYLHRQIHYLEVVVCLCVHTSYLVLTLLSLNRTISCIPVILFMSQGTGGLYLVTHKKSKSYFFHYIFPSMLQVKQNLLNFFKQEAVRVATLGQLRIA